MISKNGFLLAVEGVDGTGKQTQVTALRASFESIGHSVTTYSFPDYENSFVGPTLKSMLGGSFGNATEIHPSLSATLFAVERAEKAKRIQNELASGALVICDRYVHSNVAHQACRLPPEQRSAFQAWVERLEFDLLGMPRPNATILLDVDESEAERRRIQRAEASRGIRPLDHYEQDVLGLATAREIYKELAKILGWIEISAFSDPPEKITKRILENLEGKFTHDIRGII